MHKYCRNAKHVYHRRVDFNAKRFFFKNMFLLFEFNNKQLKYIGYL